MTNTEAMKLALEALEAFLRFAAIHHDGPDTSDKYLAEDYAVEGFRKARQVLPALRTAIAEAESMEPYAYTYMGIKADGSQHGPHLCWKPEYMDVMSANKGAVAVPLYTTPPAAQRQPLTVVEIMREWSSAKGSVVNFARAIEAAHGITGEKT